MKYLFSILLIGLFFSASAQKIKVINATSQDWAGGMAGHYGTNYLITIQCKDTNIVPDTVWINKQFYPLSSSNSDGSLKRSSVKKHEVIYTISASEFHSDSRNQLPTDTSDINSKKIIEKKISGAALITYQYKGKQHFFIVKTFKKLTRLNYP